MLAKKRVVNIDVPLLPTQKKFYFTPEKYSAFLGGFGSGKTWAFCEKGLRCALENPGAPGMLAAPTFAMLQEPLLRTFFEILEQRQIPPTPSAPIHYKYVKTPHPVVNLYNGRHLSNEIFFRSTDNPNSLRGPSLSFFGMDEAAMSDLLAWQIGIARLRHKKARYLKGFLSTTPEGTLHWITDEFVDKCEGGKREGKYRLFTASSRENIYLPDDYVSDLEESYDSILAQAYIDGLIINMTSGRAYHEFNKHNISDVEFSSYLNLGLTCDFNVSPMVWEILQYKSDYIEFIDEIVIPDNAKTEAAINIFCDWYYKKMEQLDGRKPHVNIFSDASGGHRSTVGESDHLIMKEVLISRGVPYDGHIPPGNPPVKDRLNSVNSALKDRGEFTRVKINPKCKKLIKDFQIVVLDKNGQIDKRRKELTHASDGAGYAIYTLMPITRPMQRQPLVSGSYM